MLRPLHWIACCLLTIHASTINLSAAEVVKLWPGGRAPGDTKELGPEGDQNADGKTKVAGKTIIRLGNVSEPELHIYPAPAEKATDTCIIVCPGGGHSILAWDLEGTEVAEWLNSIGINAAILKYRVPNRTENPRYTAAVQDAQRALSIARSKAQAWKIDANKIGILGFSAGGETAAMATLLPKRLYEKVDATDDIAWKPNFTVLIYPAYLVNKKGTFLLDNVEVDDKTPPMFLVHAANDPVVPESSVLLWLELKRHKIPAELHVFSQGGHGYGLRATDLPVGNWPAACAAWLKAEKWVKP